MEKQLFFNELMKSAVPSWNFRHFPSTNGINLPFQFFLPENYSPEKKYPVLLFMHGMGSVGSDGKHIYQQAASVLRQIESLEKYKSGVIVLAPHMPKGNTWVKVEHDENRKIVPTGDEITDWLFAAKELLDTAMEELPIDSRRVYGWGNSMGAYALWFLAAKFPKLLTAIVPVAGYGRPETAEKMKDVAVFAAHGDADSLVDYCGSKNMVDALIACGAKDVTLRTYEGKGLSLNDVFGPMGEDPTVLEWMFSKKSSDRQKEESIK